MRLVDANEMAAICAVHPKTLLAAARDGIVPRIVLGMKCVRFNPDKVIAALEQHGEARVLRRHNRPERVAVREEQKKSRRQPKPPTALQEPDKGSASTDLSTAAAGPT